ncbi:MAG: thymidine phosphorylase [Candidatus Spyradenecus sp.]
MVPQWFIEAKREGKAHSEAELREWVRGVADGTLPDYQIAAWLMAVYLRGLTAEETAVLTDAMMRSGECLTFDLPQPTADKHSTGGIGDKISIPLAPLCAAMGLAVPMISGRGLGLTGGTLDKLESIRGFNVRLSTADFQRLTGAIGCCMVGQTDTLAPADRRLYALRDVTATVPSIPLITASIMSKKLAEGAQTLLFDVKVGSGAFMETRERARELAQSLIATGRRLGRTCVALLTNMDQPLGRTVGNALEVRESLEILQGRGPEDVRALTVREAAEMAVAAGLHPTLEAAQAAAEAALASGAAEAKFREMVAAQGGDLAAGLPEAAARVPIIAPASGWVARVDARAIGRVALKLGAGRQAVSDPIDYAAGLDGLLQQGERVETGAPLGWLCAADEARAQAVLTEAQAAFALSPEPVAVREIIYERMA